MTNEDRLTVARNLLEPQGGALSTPEAQFISQTARNEIIWGNAVAALLGSRSLASHAKAIEDASRATVAASNESSQAAEKQAAALVTWTRALVFATVVLALATIALVCVEYGH